MVQVDQMPERRFVELDDRVRSEKVAYLGHEHKRRQSMRTKLALIVIVGLALSGWTTSASAHHAFAAEFDANKPINFKGTITKMEWVNPHSWLHVSVKKD